MTFAFTAMSFAGHYSNTPKGNKSVQDNCR